jgi:predicted patatin/cPLA2 family phospholipase
MQGFKFFCADLAVIFNARLTQIKNIESDEQRVNQTYRWGLQRQRQTRRQMRHCQSV